MKADDRDLRAMRQLIAEGAEDHRDPELLLPMAVVDGLRSLIGCHAVSVGVLDTAQRLARPWQDLPALDLVGAADPAQDEVFFRYYWDCIACSYPDRTGDLDSILRISDFYSMRQYYDTALWSEYVAPTGMGHDMLACLAGTAGRTLRLLVWRGTDRDFDDRERTILWLLRPHLYRLFQQRHASGPSDADLTPRQRQLLRLVAAGHTDRQIGRHLGISESTVRKHLQHVFERLQVNSRAAAVVRAFSPGDLPFA